uniref:Uncharacterized protein n=1 Tax=Oryza punctata TaxID=4537 RepID=A0A0E0JDZ3_ORYPU
MEAAVWRLSTPLALDADAELEGWAIEVGPTSFDLALPAATAMEISRPFAGEVGCFAGPPAPPPPHLRLVDPPHPISTVLSRFRRWLIEAVARAAMMRRARFPSLHGRISGRHPRDSSSPAKPSPRELAPAVLGQDLVGITCGRDWWLQSTSTFQTSYR